MITLHLKSIPDLRSIKIKTNSIYIISISIHSFLPVLRVKVKSSVNSAHKYIQIHVTFKNLLQFWHVFTAVSADACGIRFTVLKNEGFFRC